MSPQSSAPARIALACNSDADYASHAAVMLYSAVRNTPEASFIIYYLHDPDFPEGARMRLHKALSCFGHRAELCFIAVSDELVDGLPLFPFMKNGAMRPVMWYRVFLPQLLPDEPKVLYLDCDTLVMQSLLPLWQTKIDDKALAAVTNPFSEGYRVNGRTWPDICGLSRNEDYFNTGVMLLNLDYFREHGLSSKVQEHGRANADWVRFGDQDSLVVMLHALRVPLHPRYNLMRIIIMTSDSRRVFGHEAVSAAISAPSVLHFEGTTKPWVDPTAHPFGRAYTRYAKQMPWPTRRTSYSLLDIENLLTRHNWIRLRKWFRRVRSRLSARPS